MADFLSCLVFAVRLHSQARSIFAVVWVEFPVAFSQTGSCSGCSAGGRGSSCFASAAGSWARPLCQYSNNIFQKTLVKSEAASGWVCDSVADASSCGGSCGGGGDSCGSKACPACFWTAPLNDRVLFALFSGDAIALVLRVIHFMRTIAKLAVLAAPPIAKGRYVTGAFVIIVVCYRLANAVIGARLLVARHDREYGPKAFLAIINIAVPQLPARYRETRERRRRERKRKYRFGRKREEENGAWRTKSVK